MIGNMMNTTVENAASAGFSLTTKIVVGTVVLGVGMLGTAAVGTAVVGVFGLGAIALRSVVGGRGPDAGSKRTKVEKKDIEVIYVSSDLPVYIDQFGMKERSYFLSVIEQIKEEIITQIADGGTVSYMERKTIDTHDLHFHGRWDYNLKGYVVAVTFVEDRIIDAEKIENTTDATEVGSTTPSAEDVAAAMRGVGLDATADANGTLVIEPKGDIIPEGKFDDVELLEDPKFEIFVHDNAKEIPMNNDELQAIKDILLGQWRKDDLKIAVDKVFSDGKLHASGYYEDGKLLIQISGVKTSVEDPVAMEKLESVQALILKQYPMFADADTKKFIMNKIGEQRRDKNFVDSTVGDHIDAAIEAAKAWRAEAKVEAKPKPKAKVETKPEPKAKVEAKVDPRTDEEKATDWTNKATEQAFRKAGIDGKNTLKALIDGQPFANWGAIDITRGIGESTLKKLRVAAGVADVEIIKKPKSKAQKKAAMKAAKKAKKNGKKDAAEARNAK